jgi:ubiquinone/menaquinone biosynthesis C-methylase UbiE
VKSSSHESYVHALRYDWLTSLYDPIVRWTCRESAFKKALVQQAGISPGHKVLDLGSGTGTLTAALKEACPSAEVIGLDGDEKIIEIARSKASERRLDITFVHGISYDLPYPDDHFDRILSSFLFHHLSTEHKMATLREALRVLKPGGELHVADWGKPSNPLLRTAFLIVQLLDGFQTTSDNVKGLLPSIISTAAFDRVTEKRRFATMLGSIYLIFATKNEKG